MITLHILLQEWSPDAARRQKEYTHALEQLQAVGGDAQALDQAYRSAIVSDAMFAFQKGMEANLFHFQHPQVPSFATVRDYLVQYPDMGLNILMPMGFVQIPPRMGRELLSQGGERMRFKVAGTGAAITAGDLLKQRICRVSSVRGDYWRVFLVTELASAISKDRNSTGLTFEQTTFLNE